MTSPPMITCSNGHHDVAPRKTDQVLDSPLVVALARAAVAVMNEGVRQEPGSNSLARLRVPPIARQAIASRQRRAFSTTQSAKRGGRIFATRHRSLS